MCCHHPQKNFLRFPEILLFHCVPSYSLALREKLYSLAFLEIMLNNNPKSLWLVKKTFLCWIPGLVDHSMTQAEGAATIWNPCSWLMRASQIIQVHLKFLLGRGVHYFHPGSTDQAQHHWDRKVYFYSWEVLSFRVGEGKWILAEKNIVCHSLLPWSWILTSFLHVKDVPLPKENKLTMSSNHSSFK